MHFRPRATNDAESNKVERGGNVEMGRGGIMVMERKRGALTVYSQICARIDDEINQSPDIQCCETPDFSSPPDTFVDNV